MQMIRKRNPRNIVVVIVTPDAVREIGTVARVIATAVKNRMTC